MSLYANKNFFYLDFKCYYESWAFITLVIVHTSHKNIFLQKYQQSNNSNNYVHLFHFLFEHMLFLNCISHWKTFVRHT